MESFMIPIVKLLAMLANACRIIFLKGKNYWSVSKLDWQNISLDDGGEGCNFGKSNGKYNAANSTENNAKDERVGVSLSAPPPMTTLAAHKVYKH